MKLVWIVDFDGKKFPHRCKKDAPDAGRQRVISVRSYFAIKWIKMIRQIGFIEKKFLKVTFLSLWVIDVMMAGRFLIDTFQLNIFFYLLNISPLLSLSFSRLNRKLSVKIWGARSMPSFIVQENNPTSESSLCVCVFVFLFLSLSGSSLVTHT